MVDVDTYIDKSFYNPSLESVAFEIRFPATVRIIKDFLNFQELINESYPNFAEEGPFLEFNERMKAPENLRKFEFFDQQDQNRVKISMNAVAIITTDYSRFTNFLEKINFVIDKFIHSFNISNCLRIGLRYINVYPLSNDLNDSLNESKTLFNPYINTHLIPYDQIISQNIEVRRNFPENNKITLRNRIKYNKGKKRFQHILDFDVYSNEKININNYQNKLINLHKIEKTCFLLSVTEDFMTTKVNFLE